MNLTVESSLALSIQSLINITTGYDAYFTKLFSHPNFRVIWYNLIEQFRSSIVSSGTDILNILSTTSNDSLRSLPIIKSEDDLNSICSTRALRHWGFGEKIHDGVADFQKYYASLAAKKLDDLGGREGGLYSDMMKFLLSKSHLPYLLWKR